MLSLSKACRASLSVGFICWFLALSSLFANAQYRNDGPRPGCINQNDNPFGAAGGAVFGSYELITDRPPGSQQTIYWWCPPKGYSDAFKYTGKRYNVGVGPKPKLFDPVPPTTTPGIGEPQERQEIGSVIRPSTVFNVGFAGGFTSNRSTIEDFTPEGGGGVFGATFGARWYGLNNAFMGVQGNVLFPVVTQSTNVTSGPTVKLQTLFTQDFQVGFKLAAPETVRPADRIFFPSDFYAFIGVAEGRVQANFAPFTDTKTLIGPTFGIGFDVNVAPNVMLFGEGRYFNLNEQKFSLSGAGPITPVAQQGLMLTGGVKIQFADVSDIFAPPARMYTPDKVEPFHRVQSRLGPDWSDYFLTLPSQR